MIEAFAFYFDNHLEILKIAYQLAFFSVIGALMTKPHQSKLNAKKLGDVNPIFLVVMFCICWVPYLNFLVMCLFAKNWDNIMRKFGRA